MLEKEIFLFRDFDMSLSVAKAAQSLKFILKNDSIYSQESFQGYFPFFQGNGHISKFFETHDELIQHLKLKKNIQLDKTSLKVKIFIYLNTKKQKRIQIGEIKLQQSNPTMADKLKQLLRYCYGQHQINLYTLKQNIRFLAQALHSLFSSKKEKQMINQNKYEYQKQKIMKQLRIQMNESINKINNEFIEFKKQINTQYQLSWEKSQILLDSAIKQMKNDYTNLEIQVNWFQTRTAQQNSKLSKSIQILKNNISKIQDQSQTFMTYKYTENIYDNINELRQILNKVIQSNDEKLIVIKDEPLYSWLDQRNLQYLTIINNTITTSKPTSIYSRIKIKKAYQFTVTFTQIGSQACLGLIGSQMKEFYSSYRKIRYYNDCTFNNCDVKVEKGLGFKVGQSVTVIINLQKGQIEWKVQNETRYKTEVPLLKNTKIYWFPYIQLHQEKDSLIVNKFQ